MVNGLLLRSNDGRRWHVRYRGFERILPPHPGGTHLTNFVTFDGDRATSVHASRFGFANAIALTLTSEIGLELGKTS